MVGKMKAFLFWGQFRPIFRGELAVSFGEGNIFPTINGTFESMMIFKVPAGGS